MSADEIVVVGGSGSPKLTANICRYLGIEPARRDVFHFSEGTTFVKVGENVRGRRVYLVQSTAWPANDHFMELLFWIDALKRASAAEITVIIPYFSYGKGDKKDEPRVSIRARVCADAIEAAGASRVVTLDLHAPQIQGFFRLPVDDLDGLPVLAEAVRCKGLENLVVVSPDMGFVKQARKYADFLGTGLAIGDKERRGHDEQATVLRIIGDVEGKTALIVDDVVISGGTLVEAARQLVAAGATAVYAAVTHGVFSKDAMQQIMASPIQRLFVTDSIETQPVAFCDKIEVVSVAPLLAEAIRRIHYRESISVLFPL
ncbi:ribose-phosphate pyrophosphokinase [Litorilinea aerophila]|uniref:ribose-phosphate diphosphokinase n=1 Tax=Litorilinea aerophila TaxID=1204385 RepID=A0A540VKA4_9CHLR|nr:ribose-phosphate pyrophosphokinase [Litorilinea aerophila]MCC9075771.1 ribose-phosphate pyrophosphokinase [Litorilinea aerophila]GIV77301.1 MAG: ribose-phosphate pyrophosphokinase [Litorilinea sp.]